jgi:RNA polymerase sigma factor (sigma-70 family)
MKQSDIEFSQYFTRIAPKVLKLATRMTWDVATAEDVTAEALARTYAHWNKVRHFSYRDAWVMKTAGNIAIDLARHHNRSAHPRVSLSYFDVIDSASRNALEHDPVGATVADFRTLADGISILPPRQREAIYLHHLGELTVAETAAVMGLRPESVRTHLARGLATLRDRMRPQPMDQPAHV